jgi:hypothetical protein
MTPFSGPSQRSWLSPATDHERPEGLDRRRADLGSAPDREGHPAAPEARVGGRELDVGGGVVRIRVHRIGAVQEVRGREANVPHGQVGDAHAHDSAS